MNLVNEEYQITKDEVINNSEFTEDDLTEVYGESIEYYLKTASSKTYSVVFDFPGSILIVLLAPSSFSTFSVIVFAVSFL